MSWSKSRMKSVVRLFWAPALLIAVAVEVLVDGGTRGWEYLALPLGGIAGGLGVVVFGIVEQMAIRPSGRTDVTHQGVSAEYAKAIERLRGSLLIPEDRVKGYRALSALGQTLIGIGLALSLVSAAVQVVSGHGWSGMTYLGLAYMNMCGLALYAIFNDFNGLSDFKPLAADAISRLWTYAEGDEGKTAGNPFVREWLDTAKGRTGSIRQFNYERVVAVARHGRLEAARSAVVAAQREEALAELEKKLSAATAGASGNRGPGHV